MSKYRRRIFANWLPKGDRYFGRQSWYYDGPIEACGFWFFHIYTIWSD